MQKIPVPEAIGVPFATTVNIASSQQSLNSEDYFGPVVIAQDLMEDFDRISLPIKYDCDEIMRQFLEINFN